MSGTIALSGLLANLAVELRSMTARCHALEDGALTAMQGQPGGLSDGMLVRFQQLDHLTQGLSDLARLVEAGIGDPRMAIAIDRARVRDALTMTSLADRLLGEEPAEADQGCDFLL